MLFPVQYTHRWAFPLHTCIFSDHFTFPCLMSTFMSDFPPFLIRDENSNSRHPFSCTVFTEHEMFARARLQTQALETLIALLTSQWVQFIC